jgi:hypothetical protein
MRHVFAASALLVASTATAQLPNSSVAAFGMGGNFTAVARGYEAVRWNPANLAMPNRPFISLGVGIVNGNFGLDPVDVSTIHGYKVNADVDDATKAQWVDLARQAGGQRIRLDGGVTPLALTVGPIGLHVGTQTYTRMNLSPDAWEAMLFGNAGNNGGQPKALDLTGTSVRVGAFTTGGLSIALPLPFKLTQGILSNERAAIGITGKYVAGHGVVVAQDMGSVFGTNDTITFNLPTILPDSSLDDDFMPGTGIGADIALAWSGGPWRVGVLAENVFNSFKWDTTRFAFVPNNGTFTVDSSEVDSEEVPFSQAPAELRDLLSKQAFKPALSIGVAFNPISSLTLTADLKSYTGGDEAIIFGSKSHIGVGAEWRLLGFLPLRGGVASLSDGWQAGAGFGLRLIGYELGLATSIRRRGTATESGMMFGVVGIGR